MASVVHDPATGLGAAGGYVGDGVGTSNLAGRTLADLVLGRDTERSRLPVGRPPVPAAGSRSRVRWLEINAGLRLAGATDLEERLTGRPARLGALLGSLTGGH